MKKLTTIFATLLAVFILNSKTHAQHATRVAQFNIEKSIAIQGYDPVAYFTLNKAVKGKKNWALPLKVSPIIFLQQKIKNYSKTILKSTNLNMVAGVLMQWALQEKK